MMGMAETPEYRLIIEGICPTCRTALERRETEGWCGACQVGWAYSNDEITVTFDFDTPQTGRPDDPVAMPKATRRLVGKVTKVEANLRMPETPQTGRTPIVVPKIEFDTPTGDEMVEIDKGFGGRSVGGRTPRAGRLEKGAP